MKMKLLIILAFLVSSLSVLSQDNKAEKPNYKKIEKKIKKKKSDLFYPVLMEKYLTADTNMTLQEKRYLYYGYTFQPKYSPYGHSKYLKSINKILDKTNLDNEDYKEILVFVDSALIDNPFDLRSMNYQLQAYEGLEMLTEFDNTIFKMSTVYEVILSSGDGEEMSTAFYVISTTHEYDLLNILGFEFGGSQSLIEHYDYLKLGENEYELEGFYFDVSPCLNSLNAMFK